MVSTSTTSFSNSPSPPKCGGLNIHMLCTMAGDWNPNALQMSLTLSEQVYLWNTGLSMCRACPILFIELYLSFMSSPESVKASFSAKPRILSDDVRK